VLRVAKIIDAKRENGDQEWSPVQPAPGRSSLTAVLRNGQDTFRAIHLGGQQ
jgi:hypothetical protein